MEEAAAAAKAAADDRAAAGAQAGNAVKALRDTTQARDDALQDIRNVLTRRWPSVRLLLCPVTVQGFEAAQQVADAIKKLDEC